MILRDKISTFINKAQTKIAELSLVTSNDLYEAFADTAAIDLANELSDVISSLQSEYLDWSTFEIELALDYYNYKAELTDIALMNYNDIVIHISTGGSGVIDTGWIDAYDSLGVIVVRNKQDADSSIDDLNFRIDNLDFTSFIPQSLIDDVEDLKIDSHAHTNKGILDSIAQAHLDAILLNSQHRVDSTKHVTQTQKDRWESKPSMQYVDDGLGGKSDVAHTHEIPDIAGLEQSLIDNAPIKGDTGDTGATPMLTVGDVTVGEVLEIHINNIIPEFPTMDFVIPVAKDGEDFKIDVYGNSVDRLRSIYNDEALGFSLLGIENGVLYIRKPYTHNGDFIPATTSTGWHSVKFAGRDGWQPILAAVDVDNDTTVLQLVGWDGTQGESPTIGTDPNNPVYLGINGYTYQIESATNIKGRVGLSGPPGKIMFPEISDLFSNRYMYDDEDRDFVFLDSESGIIYIKLSSDAGDWSDGYQWKGDKGPAGVMGTQGEKGEGISEYSNTETYGIENIFVSFVNELSLDPLFQSAALYKSRVDTVSGISPEDDMYDKDTNPDGKWEYQGQTQGQTGGLTSIAQPHAIEIRGITDYAEGNNMFDLSTLFLYEFDPSISSPDDGDNFIKPNDVDSGAPGRWKKVKEFGTGGGDATSRSYTIDFGTASIVAQEINMFTSATLDLIVASNIASILLTYSGGLQQAITSGVNTIAIIAGDILTWEITRTNENELAALGIHLTINE